MLANLMRGLRSNPTGQLSWPDYLQLWEQFGFGGVQYMVPSGSADQLTALQAIRNPIILACIVTRAMAFSEVTFAWQPRGRNRQGRDLFGSSELALVEQPWPKASTGDLLARMEVDVSRFGNSYWWRRGNALVWLDPTRMRILTGDVDGPSGGAVGQQLVGYQLQDSKGQPVETFLPDEIVHHRPIPDPSHPYRGLSWLSGLLPDISSDQDMTDFKRGFLKNAAVPSLVVQFSGNMSQDAFNAFREKLESTHTGTQSAFKTLYLGAGADVKVVGSNWQDIELATTQSLGETRLCVAAGVPATIVGIAEGLKGSALNAGNYTATRRRFADLTMRPLWRAACSAIEPLLNVPAGARLWYDDRSVLFLQADMQDAASQRQSDAATITSLVNAGFDPDSVVQAVQSGDWSQMTHMGVLSVQLQPLSVLKGAPSSPADDGGDGGTDNENDG